MEQPRGPRMPGVPGQPGSQGPGERAGGPGGAGGPRGIGGSSADGMPPRRMNAMKPNSSKEFMSPKMGEIFFPEFSLSCFIFRSSLRF